MTPRSRFPFWLFWVLALLILASCSTLETRDLPSPEPVSGTNKPTPVPTAPSTEAAALPSATAEPTREATAPPATTIVPSPTMLPTPLPSVTAIEKPRKEEIVFVSGPFMVVGDLRLPEGEGPYPVVLFVHGDGPNDRVAGGSYTPIMERMARAGYATFAWDKPGTGESTGQIDRSRLGEQRAQIVLDAIEILKNRPDIDSQQIGLWGISQAGYVMPRVLLKSEDITFMIGISTPGVAGVDQGSYLVSAQAACAGLADEDVEEMRRLLLEIETAPTYDAYVQYKESLDASPGIGFASIFGYRSGVMAEDEWHPNDPESEYLWNPIEVIEQVTIPVLAFFGERDTQVDPFESVRAYQDALERAGNLNYRVELIPGTDHNIILSETGCLEERNNRPLREWTNYAPEYLDILEEWLRMLQN